MDSDNRVGWVSLDLNADKIDPPKDGWVDLDLGTLSTDPEEQVAPADEPKEGFWANLKNPITLWKEESLPANVVKWLSTPEDEYPETKETYEETSFEKAGLADPLTLSLSNILSEMEEAGMQDTQEYAETLAEFDGHQAIMDSDDPSSVDVAAIKEAFLEDPGGFGAEFVNAMVADPWMMVVPIGYELAAAKAAMVTVKAGKATQALVKVTAGLSGTAVAGAAAMAPVEIFDQLSSKNEIDWEEAKDNIALAAIAAPVLVGGFKGLSAAAKAAKAADAKIMRMSPHKSGGAAAVDDLVPSQSPEGRSIAEKASRVNDWLVDWTGGKAISPIRNMAVKGDSVAMKHVADILEPSEKIVNGKVAKGLDVERSHFERTSQRTGEFVTKVQDALSPLTSHWYGFGEGMIPLVTKGAAKLMRRPLGVLNRSMNDDVLAGVRGLAHSAEAAPAVAAIKKTLAEIHEYAVQAGMDIGHLENFFPRVYDITKLASPEVQDAFMKVLTKHGVDPGEANMIVGRIMDADGMYGLAATPVERSAMLEGYASGGKIHGRPDGHLEMSRRLKDIPDSELAPFLHNDLYASLIKYSEGVVKRAEWVRSFGRNGEKLNKLLSEARDETALSGKYTGREFDAVADRAFDLANALQGKYQPIKSSFGAGLNKTVLSYQLLRTLPLATISSLSEIVLPMLRGTGPAYLRSIPATAKHIGAELIRVVDKKFPKADSTRALEEMGLGLDAALAERLTATFGGEVSGVTSAFFKFNGLHDFTKFTRVLANETGKNMVIGHLKSLAKKPSGMRSKRFRSELLELGIDPADGLAWMKRGSSRTDSYFGTIKNAGLRFTNETIMNPRATVRPMWHSNPHFHLVSQLKGFQTVFGNTAMKRVHRELTKVYKGDPEAAAHMAAKLTTAVTLMTLTAVGGNMLRERIKYGPGGNPRFKNEDSYMTGYRAFERTGMLGVLQFASDATLAHRFGSSGLGALLGPTGSQADELMEGTGKLRESLGGKKADTGKLKREAVNAVPFVNVHKEWRDNMLKAIK